MADAPQVIDVDRYVRLLLATLALLVMATVVTVLVVGDVRPPSLSGLPSAAVTAALVLGAGGVTYLVAARTVRPRLVALVRAYNGYLAERMDEP